MTPRSHDPNAPTGLTRRQRLQGTLVLTVTGLTGSQMLRTVAQNPTESLDASIALSQTLTARLALDHGVDARLLAALSKPSVGFVAQLRSPVQTLTAGLPSDVQQKAALQILEAWYLGVVDDNVATYEQALIYGMVPDTSVTRTCYPNQSGFWTEPPIER